MTRNLQRGDEVRVDRRPIGAASRSCGDFINAIDPEQTSRARESFVDLTLNQQTISLA
jgi:hypothetical protein